ncbi:hypothetical protein VKT23_011573 [Stygiomarasmius scandens]|uniref:Isomerase YbhE n=1 Tax=Marasmiellus scandens TaxID=2682957 RepID=A0ABR1JD99_9AGAR
MRINTYRKWVNPPIYGNSPIFFCTMETAQSFLGLDVPAQTQNTLHILSGSFRSISLFLLAFSPANRSLSLVQTVDAFGPHQYLALNPTKDRAFATTWSLPPSLSSWEIDRNEWKVNHINNVPITATSSYIILPPPYAHIYSAGGPTGEIHAIDPSTGGFSKKIQQFLFVPEDELEKADKTRVALRYGSHGVEFSTPLSLAFIPVLGTDSIEVYTHDKQTGSLTHVYSSPSPRGEGAHDGPRHVKVHPNGKVLYCVTEHSNYLDTYSITITAPYLTHLSSRSLLPPSLSHPHPQHSKFRGDTLLLTPSTPSSPTPHTIWATTRGGKEDVRGWISVFQLGEDGDFVKAANDEDGDGEEYGIERYETPTSGGKANAIDLYPKVLLPESVSSMPSNPENDTESSEEAVYILLTDDSDYASIPPSGQEEKEKGQGQGGVRVLEWNGWGTGGVKEIVGWPGPSDAESEVESGKERMMGGSHALWLD